MNRLFILLLTMAVVGGCGKSEKVQKPPDAKEEKGKEVEKTMERVGPGWAVEGYELTGRIKLSEKAIKRLGLSTSKAALSQGVVHIDVESVVEDKGLNFVYLQEADGWMKRVPVKTGPRSGSKIPILSGLAPGAVYVDKGAPLVRLAELDLVSGEEVE